jgi:protein SCO1
MTRMQGRTRFQARRFLGNAILASAVFISVGLAACSSPKPAEQRAQPAEGPRRYKLEGRVVSIDTARQRVTVDGKDIPGFMSAMSMGYAVKNPDLLTPLSAEDQIMADVVVNGSDVYLENIVVVKKAANAKPPASGAAPPASSQPAK